MGKIATAGAIAGLGKGIAEAGERKEQTARELKLEQMRNEGAMERQQAADTAASERQEARYGPGGLEAQREEAAAGTEFFRQYGMSPEDAAEQGGAKGIEHAQALELERTRGQYTRAPTSREDVQTVQIPGFVTPEGTITPPKTVTRIVERDPQGNVTGVYEQDPVSMRRAPEGLLGTLNPYDMALFRNPDKAADWMAKFKKDLPAWFKRLYPEYVPSAEPVPETPTPDQSSVDTTGQEEGGEGAGGMISQAARKQYRTGAPA